MNGECSTLAPDLHHATVAADYACAYSMAVGLLQLVCSAAGLLSAYGVCGSELLRCGDRVLQAWLKNLVLTAPWQVLGSS